VLLARLVERPYDGFLAYSCYENYRSSSDPEFLELAVKLTLPLVKLVHTLEFHTWRLDEDLVSHVASHLTQQLLEKRYVGEFENFLPFHRTSIRHAFQRYIGSLPRATFIDMQRIDVGRVSTTIHQIFLEELPDIIRDRCLDKFRFQGHEYRGCIYILDQMMSDEEVVVAYLKRQFQMRDPLFFIDYVTVIVRSVLYDMKDQIAGPVVDITEDEVVEIFDPEIA
jgi:hypothetical protein